MRLCAHAKEVLLLLTIPLGDYCIIAKSKTFWSTATATLMSDYNIYFEVILTCKWNVSFWNCSFYR